MIESMHFVCFVIGLGELLGTVNIDLTPIGCGMPGVCGWYNIVDKAGCCLGQLQVCLGPR